MNIVVCGGGNIGHVMIGFLGAQEGVKVSLLTTRPERWGDVVEVADSEGREYRGRLSKVSSNPSEVIPEADIVVVCLPGFAIGGVLRQISPYLREGTLVGTVVSSTGFFFEAMRYLPSSQPLFGFQRVPFISRVVEYGRSAQLKGYKSLLRVAVERSDCKDVVRKELERLFKVRVELLDSYYEVSLSNSNPLLHTARLYTMFRDWRPGVSYDESPQFYSSWSVEASELLIAMDVEFQSLLVAIGLRKGCVPPILEYYESSDALSLTRKLRSIPAFQGIASPMVATADGRFVPDFNSRYFTEDFMYGMRFIVETAAERNVPVPTISNVYEWGKSNVYAYTSFRCPQ